MTATTIPGEGAWTFEDANVADTFDRHVREQLPWYDLATGAVAQIARHYVGPSGLVYDIGASTGNIGRALEPILSARSADLVSIEASAEMAAKWSAPGVLEVARAESYDYAPFDLAVCFLALMFLRVDDAHALLARLYSRMLAGSALIVVERTLPLAGYPGVITSRMTLSAKRTAGASDEEIVSKELSLAGVQRPLDPAVLARYGAVEFLRFGDFAGYLIEAPK